MDDARRILVVVSVLIVVVVSVTVFGPVKGGGEKTNVLFITVDALRADRLGVYGYRRNTSPNVDSFAADSTVFTDSVSPSASTILSMPSIFTSLYPLKDNVVDLNGTRSWNANLSLVKRFQEKGYWTVGVVAHTYVKSEFGFDRYFDVFNDNFSIGWEKENLALNLSYHEKINRYFERRTAEETTSIAVDRLREGREPFFMWLHYSETHAPYVPPNITYYEKFNSGCVPNVTSVYNFAGRRVNLSNCQVQYFNELYDAEVRYFDKYFGKLLQELKEKNLYEDTIIVLTSDHGECLGEHNLIDHNYLHPCSFRVPLIVHVPGHSSGRIQRPVSTIDIMPTLMKLLGIEPGRRTRGENLFSSGHRRYQYIESRTDKVFLRNGAETRLEDINPVNLSKNYDSNSTVPGSIKETLRDLGYYR